MSAAMQLQDIGCRQREKGCQKESKTLSFRLKRQGFMTLKTKLTA
jgi:hypothetical protein